MAHQIQKALSPEEQELEHKQAELDALKGVLAQRELELTTLDATLRQFQQRYLHIVGVKLARLDELDARIAEVLALLVPRETLPPIRLHTCGQKLSNLRRRPALTPLNQSCRQNHFAPTRG